MKILFVTFYLDFIVKSLEMFEFGDLKGLHFRMGLLTMDHSALWERPLVTSDIRVGRGSKIAPRIGRYRVLRTR